MAKKQHNITVEVCINRIMQFNDNSFCPDLIRNLIRTVATFHSVWISKFKIHSKKYILIKSLKISKLIKMNRNFDRRQIIDVVLVKLFFSRMLIVIILPSTQPETNLP